MSSLSDLQSLTVAVHETSYADIVQRLANAFGDQFSLPTILDLVAEARTDLAGSPSTAMPELTERLAYQRLSQLAT
jgi:hypothetical protein